MSMYCLQFRGPRTSAEDAALGEAMVASKREEMDREIDHLLITQSENLRRYWEVSSPFPDLVMAFSSLYMAVYTGGGFAVLRHVSV